MIDWTNSEQKISKYFKVKEVLLLPSWGVYHVPSEQEKEEIVKLAQIMDIIREKFNASISVHCWIRPTSANCPGSRYHGKNYNLEVGSTSTKSGHIFGMAIDFHVKGYEGKDGCAKVRAALEPILESLDIRMEDIDGSWVHVDTKPVISKRFFKP